MSYEVLESKLIFEGKVMSMYRDKLMMPDGKKAFREYIERGGASAIVPVLDSGEILFVRQYRHPIRQEILEIPAGMIDENEDPLVCAGRELEEETGYKSENITFVNSIYTSVGVCSEELYLYIAENLKPGKQHFDPDEFIEVEKYTLEEALNMIFD